MRRTAWRRPCATWHAPLTTCGGVSSSKSGSIRRAFDSASRAVESVSQYSQPVKKFAENVSKTPHASIVKVADSSYWVIQALRKVDAEYRSLESPEIKEGLRQMVVGKKKEAELDKNMEILKSEMNVVENFEYFDKKTALQQRDREESVQGQYGINPEELIDSEDISGNISKV